MLQVNGTDTHHYCERFLAALLKQLTQKKQIGRIFDPMRHRFHPPEQAGRSKGNRHAPAPLLGLHHNQFRPLSASGPLNVVGDTNDVVLPQFAGLKFADGIVRQCGQCRKNFGFVFAIGGSD